MLARRKTRAKEKEEEEEEGGGDDDEDDGSERLVDFVQPMLCYLERTIALIDRDWSVLLDSFSM